MSKVHNQEGQMTVKQERFIRKLGGTPQATMTTKEASAYIDDLLAGQRTPSGCLPEDKAVGLMAQAGSGRMMTSKFGGRCKDCGTRTLAGERIEYLGKGNGIRCFKCADPAGFEAEQARLRKAEEDRERYEAKVVEQNHRYDTPRGSAGNSEESC
jgi:hypothetical protein